MTEHMIELDGYWETTGKALPKMQIGPGHQLIEAIKLGIYWHKIDPPLSVASGDIIRIRFKETDDVDT